MKLLLVIDADGMVGNARSGSLSGPRGLILRPVFGDKTPPYKDRERRRSTFPRLDRCSTDVRAAIGTLVRLTAPAAVERVPHASSGAGPRRALGGLDQGGTH